MVCIDNDGFLGVNVHDQKYFILSDIEYKYGYLTVIVPSIDPILITYM